jgi:CHASE3 domain sensor protein
MKALTDHWKSAILAVAILLIVASGVLAYRAVLELTDSMRSLDQSQRLIGTAHDLAAMLAQAEAYARANVITGDETNRGNFERAFVAVQQLIPQLEKELGGGTLQQRNIDELRSLVGDKLATMQDMLRGYRAEGIASAVVSERLNQSAGLMSRIRGILDAITDEERMAYIVRQHAAEDEANQMLVAIATGGGASCVIICWLFILVSAETRRRRSLNSRPHIGRRGQLSKKG